MLSGNGRHRRPRQAPALLVAAGVTGSAIAIPLFAAGGASAADGTVWDKVAQCETGGSWSADSGDGQYGGLNLTQEDWESYGGLDYAASPDLASRNQQIAVAQKLLADEGVDTWGTCAVTTGLTEKSGALDVDTGVEDDSDKSDGSGQSGDSGESGDSSGSSSSSGLSDLSKGSSSGSSGNSGNSGNSGTSSSSGSSGSSGSSESSGSGESSTGSSGKSTSSPSSAGSSGDSGVSANDDGNSQKSGDSYTITPEGDDSGNSVQDEGSWSLVDTGSLDSPDSSGDSGASGSSGSGRHRGANADESEREGAGTGPSVTSSGRHAASGTYTVREGDSLTSIADSLGLDGGWRALYAENKDVVGADPSAIMPGQKLGIVIQ